MKLAYSPASPYVRKVTACAIKRGLNDKIERLKIGTTDPALLQYNALSKVPTLITDDGMSIFDSPVICEYLDSLGTAPKLIPAAGPARWKALTQEALADGILDATQPRRRELTLPQIQEIATALPDTAIEFFIHGALCVAYSGQCYVSHAQTGRSANRGDCSQACRLPWTVTDTQGRIVAHEKHVLSMKDNNQSANLGALIDAGVRSFKIEGRYKDMGYVKNITADIKKRYGGIQ